MYQTACRGFKEADIDNKTSRICFQRFADMQEEMKPSEASFLVKRATATLQGTEDSNPCHGMVSQAEETAASYSESKRRRQTLEIDVPGDGETAKKRLQLIT